MAREPAEGSGQVEGGSSKKNPHMKIFLYICRLVNYSQCTLYY